MVRPATVVGEAMRNKQMICIWLSSRFLAPGTSTYADCYWHIRLAFSLANDVVSRCQRAPR